MESLCILRAEIQRDFSNEYREVAGCGNLYRPVFMGSRQKSSARTVTPGWGRENGGEENIPQKFYADAVAGRFPAAW